MKMKELKNALDYIESNLVIDNEDNIDYLNINNISDKSNISSSNLQMLFKKIFKITIREYIAKRRMNLAIHCLIETKESITEISNKYGYEIDSFIRTFKKIYKVTPYEFRKNGKIINEFNAFELKFEEIDIKNLELVKKDCNSCSWRVLENNIPICAGYNKTIKKLLKEYPNACESFSYTFHDYIKNEELKEEYIKELINGTNEIFVNKYKYTIVIK